VAGLLRRKGLAGLEGMAAAIPGNRDGWLLIPLAGCLGANRIGVVGSFGGSDF